MLANAALLALIAAAAVALAYLLAALAQIPDLTRP